MAAETPSGWYPDPQVPGIERYWDGVSWTDQQRTTAHRGVSASEEKRKRGNRTAAIVAGGGVGVLALFAALGSWAGDPEPTASQSPASVHATTVETVTETVTTTTAVRSVTETEAATVATRDVPDTTTSPEIPRTTPPTTTELATTEPAAEAPRYLVPPTEDTATGGGSVYFKNCTAARDAGAAPVRRGDPGYGAHLDRDGDGVGCE